MHIHRGSSVWQQSFCVPSFVATRALLSCVFCAYTDIYMSIYIYTHTYTYIYVYIYMYVCIHETYTCMRLDLRYMFSRQKLFIAAFRWYLHHNWPNFLEWILFVCIYILRIRPSWSCQCDFVVANWTRGWPKCTTECTNYSIHYIHSLNTLS